MRPRKKKLKLVLQEKEITRKLKKKIFKTQIIFIIRFSEEKKCEQ